MIYGNCFQKKQKTFKFTEYSAQKHLNKHHSGRMSNTQIKVMICAWDSGFPPTDGCIDAEKNATCRACASETCFDYFTKLTLSFI